MRNKTRLLSMLALLIISIVPTVANAQMASDRRLSKTTALECNSQPLQVIIANYSKDFGINLSVEPAIADTPVTGKLSSRPAHQVLQSLADLVLGEWTKNAKGYLLKRSSLGEQKEASIFAECDWTIAERRERIVRAMQVPQETWQKTVEPFPSLWSNAVYTSNEAIEMPSGFTYPEDYYIALALSSPFRHTVLDLALTLPQSTWEDMPNGVEVPISSFPKDKRDVLVKLFKEPVPNRPGTKHLEEWPVDALKDAVLNALANGDGEFKFRLETDQLGRWSYLSTSIETERGNAEISNIPIGIQLQSDVAVHRIYFSQPGSKPSYSKALKLLPRADDIETLINDQWLAEELEPIHWPAFGTDVDFREVPYKTLNWMGDILKIDYLAAKYDINASYYTAGLETTMARGKLLDRVASALFSKWERASGVYLFREENWPLKRQMYIRDEFFRKYEVKLSPEGLLSLDDIASAYSELNPKQRNLWYKHSHLLPLKHYARIIYDDGLAVSKYWSGFTPEQKERMKLVFERGKDYFPIDKGISLTELNPEFQQILMDRIKEKYPKYLSGSITPKSIRFGWLRYSSDPDKGIFTDTLEFRLFYDSSATVGSIFSLTCFTPKGSSE